MKLMKIDPEILNEYGDLISDSTALRYESTNGSVYFFSLIKKNEIFCNENIAIFCKGKWNIVPVVFMKKFVNTKLKKERWEIPNYEFLIQYLTKHPFVGLRFQTNLF